jgi:hypothetical protein
VTLTRLRRKLGAPQGLNAPAGADLRTYRRRLSQACLWVEVTEMFTQLGPDGGYVDLFWLPLGAGAVAVVRWSGRLYEAIAARTDRREVCDLYHSALQVQVGSDRYVIEMAPVWGNKQPDRGVVSEGAVGLPSLGRSRLFRYEVRCWLGGVIPDIGEAVFSPQRLSTDIVQARRVLDLVPAFPALTWGRDELDTGEMWNSNSLIAWLLARSGHRVDLVNPPVGGRAPGWLAGLVAATRDTERAVRPRSTGVRQKRPAPPRGTRRIPMPIPNR